MKYPAMNKRPRQAVVAPDFSGGLNLRDGISQIADNQLTDCLNMWFKDGALRTRPGVGSLFVDKENIKFEKPRSAENWTAYSHDVFKKIGTETCQLFSYCAREFTDNKCSYITIKLYWLGKNVFEHFQDINSDYITEHGNYFITEKSGRIYLFMENGDILGVYEKGKEVLNLPCFPEVPYIPTVITNAYVLTSAENGFIGDALETENIIGDYHKIIYSSVNPNHPENIMENGENSGMLHSMNYPNNNYTTEIEDYAGMKVTAVLKDPSNGVSCTHEIELDENGNGEEAEAGDDGYTMAGNVNSVYFMVGYDIPNITISNKTKYLKNNLEITFPVIRSEPTKESVFNASRAVWFGGGAGGLSGGTRLFICGNPNEKNIVRWSHRDNPLYWPENNFFEVGDQSQAVTGFGKQENMLVIFKENETYYTQYNQNTDITAEDLSTQSVIDYNSASVYFPLIQLNPNIGCDCPGTIQLCRNRLVWANSNGKVYSLVSTNNYSERTIYEIGEMMFNRLCKETNLKNAVSCDWEDHYVLAVGNHLYVMDYNSSGYQYSYSYQKDEDANARIPWYYWELPTLQSSNIQLEIISSLNRMIFVHSNVGQDNSNEIDLFELGNVHKDFNEHNIQSCMQTKLFYFNTPGYYKNVDSVSLTLQNNDGAPIRVTFVTDTGIDEHIVSLDGADTGDFSPASLKSVVLHPCIRSYERFGVRLECDGPLAVDSMTLTYRILGGVR